MTQSRRKLREFWIDPTPDNAEELANELDTAIYIAMDKHPRQGPLQWQSNLINVREVSPDYDKAVESMVEALRFYASGGAQRRQAKMALEEFERVGLQNEN